jgi:hypothetical protein
MATVNASAESVMAWWYSPDRRADFQSRVERLGGIDFSLSESTNDRSRVRIAHWYDLRGWEHKHEVKWPAMPEGIPERSGDRFVLPVTDITSYSHRQARTRTVICLGRIEFVPHANDETEIAAFHNHTAVGGTWFQRRRMQESNQKNTDDSFRDQIERCRTAVGRSTAQSQSLDSEAE